MHAYVMYTYNIQHFSVVYYKYTVFPVYTSDVYLYHMCETSKDLTSTQVNMCDMCETRKHLTSTQVNMCGITRETKCPYVTRLNQM